MKKAKNPFKHFRRKYVDVGNTTKIRAPNLKLLKARLDAAAERQAEKEKITSGHDVLPISAPRLPQKSLELGKQLTQMSQNKNDVADKLAKSILSGGSVKRAIDAMDIDDQKTAKSVMKSAKFLSRRQLFKYNPSYNSGRIQKTDNYLVRVKSKRDSRMRQRRSAMHRRSGAKRVSTVGGKYRKVW
ncbi:MAG: hypothetical protein QKV59_gp3 [Avonheates virus SG_19]|uniref:hypothetical protein n=1 Tax=Avonheates virus SG_19 TaxID=2914483 RepID=UPI002481B96F|nr:MAG: hypothetical protein QKV59_gp3 [Avonheates virus SG_19]UNI72611.1 MAG: hypothetical protein [Avonheates virus SG_19]